MTDYEIVRARNTKATPTENDYMISSDVFCVSKHDSFSAKVTSLSKNLVVTDHVTDSGEVAFFSLDQNVVETEYTGFPILSPVEILADLYEDGCLPPSFYSGFSNDDLFDQAMKSGNLSPLGAFFMVDGQWACFEWNKTQLNVMRNMKICTISNKFVEQIDCAVNKEEMCYITP